MYTVYICTYALLITGLGCSFLTEQCTNKSVYPYLCDENANPEICTSDHLSKVSKLVSLISKQ